MARAAIGLEEEVEPAAVADEHVGTLGVGDRGDLLDGLEQRDELAPRATGSSVLSA